MEVVLALQARELLASGGAVVHVCAHKTVFWSCLRQNPLLYGLEHDTRIFSASVSHSFELTTRLFSLKTLFCLNDCTMILKRGVGLHSTTARVIRVKKTIAADNKLSLYQGN